MKARWTILIVAVLGLWGIAVRRASADYAYSASVEVQNASDFYEPLSPLGHWVQVNDYGWCWYPAYVENTWRPYATGHWMLTEDGWYWMSEEPWAWATYHYGRWMWDSYYGWLWVPGVEWAPAWVSWREGGDYVGWAPLPPSCGFGPQQTVIYAERVVYAPNAFVFIERRHFCEPIRPSVLVVNQTVVNKTVNITKIRRIDQVVINPGPRVDEIQRVTKREVPFAQIKDLRANGSSRERREIPAPRERPNRARETYAVAVQQQATQRSSQREIPVVRVTGGARDVRPAVAMSTASRVRDASEFVRPQKQGFPSAAVNPRRDNGGQGHNEMPDRVKPQRQVVLNSVAAPPPTLPRVAQADRRASLSDSGGSDKHHGRDNNDEQPRNGRHN